MKMETAARLAHLFIVIFAGVILSACARGTDRVRLHDPMAYKPGTEEGIRATHADTPEVRSLVGERISLVLKRVRDNRRDISKIGTTKNSYGMETGNVEVEEGVVFVDVFTQNFINCLELAGYEVTPLKQYDASSRIDKEKAKGLVEGEIRTFWTTFVPGIFSVDAVGEVMFEVRVYEPGTNREIWSKTFRGKAIAAGIAGTRGMYEESINLAYSQAMKSLYNSISGEELRKMLKK